MSVTVGGRHVTSPRQSRFGGYAYSTKKKGWFVIDGIVMIGLFFEAVGC